MAFCAHAPSCPVAAARVRLRCLVAPFVPTGPPVSLCGTGGQTAATSACRRVTVALQLCPLKAAQAALLPGSHWGRGVRFCLGLCGCHRRPGRGSRQPGQRRVLPHRSGTLWPLPVTVPRELRMADRVERRHFTARESRVESGVGARGGFPERPALSRACGLQHRAASHPRLTRHCRRCTARVGLTQSHLARRERPESDARCVAWHRSVPVARSQRLRSSLLRRAGRPCAGGGTASCLQPSEKSVRGGQLPRAGARCRSRGCGRGLGEARRQRAQASAYRTGLRAV